MPYCNGWQKNCQWKNYKPSMVYFYYFTRTIHCFSIIYFLSLVITEKKQFFAHTKRHRKCRWVCDPNKNSRLKCIARRFQRYFRDGVFEDIVYLSLDVCSELCQSICYSLYGLSCIKNCLLSQLHLYISQYWPQNHWRHTHDKQISCRLRQSRSNLK